MLIKLTHPELPRQPSVSFKDMIPSVLYKEKDSNRDTFYVKTLSNMLVWFENGRLGSRPGIASDRYVKAPKGTKVVLEA